MYVFFFFYVKSAVCASCGVSRAAISPAVAMIVYPFEY